MAKTSKSTVLSNAAHAATIAAFVFLVWSYYNPYQPPSERPVSETVQPAPTEPSPDTSRSFLLGPDWLRWNNGMMWALVALVLAGGLHLAAALVRRAERRYPEVTVYSHLDGLANNPALIDSVRRLFEESGWRVIFARTDVPRHSKGIWLHGGTPTERNIATWGLQTLGITPQVDHHDDKPPSLQVIVGTYDPPRRGYTGTDVEDDIARHEATREYQTVVAERDSLKILLDQSAQELTTRRAKLDETLAEVALCKLERLGRRYAPENTNAKVTVRFIDYADARLADRVKELFAGYTRWTPEPKRDDGSVVRPPNDQCRVWFESGTPELVRDLAFIFNEGNLLREPVASKGITNHPELAWV